MVMAPTQTTALSTLLNADRLSRHLPTPGVWRPVPTVSDRLFWEGVEQTTRDAFIGYAEGLRREPWPVLTASLWRDFSLTGNRTRYQDQYFLRRRRLASAVMAACLTDDAGWHAEVLDGLWLLCEESSWCLPAHDPSVRPDGTVLPDPARPWIDLFVAETAALLAWTHAVLSERLGEIAPIAVSRLAEAVRDRLLRPYRADDTWWWLGFGGSHVSNWNSWINSNVLACSLLLDDSRDHLVATASRVAASLDHFLAGYPDDGACSEGPHYWWRAAGSLFESLEYLYSASRGALNGFGMPLLRNMGRYLHSVHIAGDWYVNVADADARVKADDHHCAQLLYRFGRRVGDEEMVAHALAMRGHGPSARPGACLSRALVAVADAQWRGERPCQAPLVAHSWWPDTQLLTARQHAGREEGLFLAVKGGHNGEDHNHNDVGSILVAVDGYPVLVDVGIADYTSKNSNPATRYQLWTHRSDYHNVPNVDGHEQLAGAEHRARDASAKIDESGAQIAFDIASAYPTTAGIRRWTRTVTLDRSGQGSVTLIDSWALENRPESLVLHLMASARPCEACATGDGTLVIPTAGRSLVVSYRSPELAAAVERITIEERRPRRVWGECLWRISLTARQAEREGLWTVYAHVGGVCPHEPDS